LDAAGQTSINFEAQPKRDSLNLCLRWNDRIPVEHRFENHKNGYKSAWVVKKYGKRLMPELYQHLNPMRLKPQLKWKRNWPKI